MAFVCHEVNLPAGCSAELMEFSLRKRITPREQVSAKGEVGERHDSLEPTGSRRLLSQYCL
jgi:hypothetical protein